MDGRVYQFNCACILIDCFNLFIFIFLHLRLESLPPCVRIQLTRKEFSCQRIYINETDTRTQTKLLVSVHVANTKYKISWTTAANNLHSIHLFL